MDDKSESDFWKEIEDLINEPVPELIKFLLTKCGYNSRTCLRNIKLDDVIVVEQFVTYNIKEILVHMKNQPECSDLKIHRGQPFEFLPGHRKFIVNIGEILAADRKVTSCDFEKGEEVRPPSEEDSARLKKELCDSILNWAGKKNFDESVSKCYCIYSKKILLSILRRFKVINGIDIDQIFGLMGKSEKLGGGFVCQVLCPVQTCGKRIGCIYKKYNRKAVRKNNKENGNASYRKPSWYFPNFKTHLTYHPEQLRPPDRDILSLSNSLEYENSEHQASHQTSDNHLLSTVVDTPQDNCNTRDENNAKDNNANESLFNVHNMSLHFTDSVLSSPILQTTSYPIQKPKFSVKNLISVFNSNDKN